MTHTRRSRGDDTPAPNEKMVATTTNNKVRVAQAQWTDTYAAAQCWVKWTARRRWPDHPAHDDVWAMSVTSWWHGPGDGS